MTINSGILFLEKFIEDSNLLPSDLGRLLNFIKALDERLQETTAEADDRLKAFVGSQRVAAQRPEEVNEQRMAIDCLHTEMIHLQEEKNLVSMQLEALLRGKEEELARSEAALKRELSISETENRHAQQPQQFAVGMPPAHAPGTYHAMSGSGRNGSVHGVQPVEHGQRKSAAIPVAGQMTMGGRHHSQHNLPQHHAQVAGAPMHMAQPVMAPYVVNGGHMGAPIYAYSNVPQQPVDPQEMADPGPTFMPVDPSMNSHASKPQAKNGHFLSMAEISPDLQGKQAELLWPDDGQWYLVMIRTVDMYNRTADIQYYTGEHESNLNLEEVVTKRELRIIPG